MQEGWLVNAGGRKNHNYWLGKFLHSKQPQGVAANRSAVCNGSSVVNDTCVYTGHPRQGTEL